MINIADMEGEAWYIKRLMNDISYLFLDPKIDGFGHIVYTQYEFFRASLKWFGIHLGYHEGDYTKIYNCYYSEGEIR